MRIPLNASTFDEKEINAAIEVLRSGFVTMGGKCFAFEEKFAKHMGVKNAIFVNSGSSANLLAFFAIANFAAPNSRYGASKLSPGDEIIVPAVTWSTTVWPVVQAGLVPVLVDCDPKSLQMKPEAVRKAIGPKTKAICPVHVLGNSVDLDAVLNIAKEHSLWVVEDTCEALGTRYKKKFVGTYGDIGTYSFFFSHHITTIEGGMVVTDNDELAELLRCMRAHGWTRHLKNRESVEKNYPDIDPRFMFVNTGFNLRPTEINAAFGLEQIDRLEAFNSRRVEIANYWRKEFAHLIEKGLFVPMQTTMNADSTWFGFPIVCNSQDTRNALRAHLEKSGIETRPIICGNLARQPAFKNVQHRISGSLDGADIIMDQGLFWGSHPMMEQAELDYVVEVVKGFFK